MAALVAILAIATIAQVVGIRRDLPSPEVDEPFFVLPAVEMAARGSLDPHWFGHPGSTVILPLAIAYRAREVLFHGAPLVGAAPSAAARFRADPTWYYLLGRLWSVLLFLFAILLVFLLGRRLFDDATALVAAFGCAVVPLLVNYGRIVRTDAAGACFSLLALLAIVAYLDGPTTRRAVMVGAAIGLAVASRWFLAVLGPVALAAWWSSRTTPTSTSARRPFVVAPLVMGASALAVFALITPFFFLDWHAVSQSLQAETVGHLGNEHRGWLDALGFYVGDAIPAAVSWPAFVASIVGVAMAFVARDVRRLLLVGYAALFLGAISVASLEWARWIIPVVPVVMLFAASAVVAVARLATSRLSDGRSRWLRGAVIVAGACVVVVGPVIATVTLDRAVEAASTRQLMRRWIVHHVPLGSRVAEEVKAPELRTAGYFTIERYDLPAAGTVADYLVDGFHYMVVNAHVALDYRADARRYPHRAAFYEFLRRHATLLHEDRANGRRTGPHLELYRVDEVELTAAHGRVDHFTTVRSSRDRVLRVQSLYPVGGELLR